MPLDYRAVIASETWSKLSSAATAAVVRLAAHYWACGRLPGTLTGRANKAGLSRTSFTDFVWPQIKRLFAEREDARGRKFYVYLPLEDQRNRALARRADHILRVHQGRSAKDPSYRPNPPEVRDHKAGGFEGVKEGGRRRAHACWHLAPLFGVPPRQILTTCPHAPEDLDVESWAAYSDKVGRAQAWQTFCRNPKAPPPEQSFTA